MRSQICGDSTLLVRWTNGEWKCDSAQYRPLIHNLEADLHVEWVAGSMAPLSATSEWCLWIPREHNCMADQLADLGSHRGGLDIHVLATRFKERPVALRGFFDGTAGKGSHEAGSGWIIFAVWADDLFSWHRVVSGWSTVPGLTRDALAAEWHAMSSLVNMMIQISRYGVWGLTSQADAAKRQRLQ